MTQPIVKDEASLYELGRAYGVTPRAIRFYDEVGLVRPRRGRRNGRVFDPAEQERLRLVVELRRAGVPISDIQAIIQAGRTAGPAVQRRLMAGALRERLEALDEARRSLLEAADTIQGLVADLTAKADR